MSPEQYITSVEAEVELGDTAVLTAVPRMKGVGAGPTWHIAKIAKCGCRCTESPGLGGVLIRVGQDAVGLEPRDIENQCSPETASANLLCKNCDPFKHTEPGG
jgi:hypothetical protein